MDTRKLKYNGHEIKVSPAGEFSLTDITKALGYVGQRSTMHVKAYGDIYAGQISKYTFVRKGPPGVSITREGAMAYLDNAVGKEREAGQIKRLLRDFNDSQLDPAELRTLECQEVLRNVNTFLDKLPGIPVNLVEEFAVLRQHINAVI